MNIEKKKIAIIGFGRFGKLLANMLLPYASISIITSQEIEGGDFKKIEYSGLGEMDIIVPAVPISQMTRVLRKVGHVVKQGTLVMDVCSVKVLPCEWMSEMLPTECEILGTHPMFGPDSAKNGLEGLQVVVCPISVSDEKYDWIKNVFSDMKLKITETSPEDHDEQAARSLAMVHFIGRGLNRVGVSEQEISTVGFERLLSVDETVSNDTWQLFLDMHKYNPYAKEVRNNLIDELIELNELLINEEV